MTKTTNYNLNQWGATDKIKRADFNADNAAIDTALKAVANTAASAQSSAATAAANAAVAAARGNCQIYYTTRVGTDTTSRITLTVPKGKPHLFFLCTLDGQYYMLCGRGGYFAALTSNHKSVTFVWNDHSVSWGAGSTPAENFNLSSQTYYIVVLSEIS